MPDIGFRPELPIDITVSFHSPQVASCNLWYRAPGADWKLFARATDEDEVTESSHTYALGPVPDGTEVRYRFLFIGNPDTAVRARLRCAQQFSTLPGGALEEEGSTDQDGVAVRRGEVRFAAV